MVDFSLLSFIVFLLLILGLMWRRIQTIKKLELALRDERKEFQKVIQQLIHDIKNPIATLAMAMHNLQFSIENKTDAETKELFATINESVSDTTTQLEEIAIFSRTGSSHFRTVDPISYIGNNLPETESPIKVVTDFPDELPNLYADQQALDLVVQKLLTLCKNKKDTQQIIHISVSEIDIIKHTIEYKFFNHRLLSSDSLPGYQVGLIQDKADDYSQFTISIINIILARHSSELKGLFDPEAGSTFSFQLRANIG